MNGWMAAMFVLTMTSIGESLWVFFLERKTCDVPKSLWNENKCSFP